MKKFFYRLEMLLTLRSGKEKRAQRELLFYAKKLEGMRGRRDTITQQIASLLEEMQRKRKQNDRSLEETYLHLLEHLKGQLLREEEAILVQEKGVEELKSRLKRIVYERKVIEKIKEKHYAHWSNEMDQLEGSLIDENTSHSK